MRHFINAAFVAAGLSIIGCSASTGAEDANESSTEDALSIKQAERLLPGEYSNVKTTTVPPRFTLGTTGTYTLDTGARCVTFPCDVASEEGTWAATKVRGDINVKLTSKDGKKVRSFVALVAGSNVTLKGVDGTFKKSGSIVGCDAIRCQAGFTCENDDLGAGQCVKTSGCATVRCAAGTVCDDSSGTAVCKPTTTCAAVRCAANTFCDDTQGSAKCIPYPTCATQTERCATGEHCEDSPIVCVRAPCAPTAPSCKQNVCPSTAWVNCMPGPGRVNPLCESDYRAWVLASCPGVNYAD